MAKKTYSHGLSCSPQYNFSHRHYYEKHTCEYWQMAFYNSWKNHGYIGKIVPEFKCFDNAYRWLISDPARLAHYKAHCGQSHGSYDWETDACGGFGPNMKYVSHLANIAQAVKDHSDYGHGLNNYKNIRICISFADGSYNEFDHCKDAASYLNCSHQSISNWYLGKSRPASKYGISYICAVERG